MVSPSIELTFCQIHSPGGAPSRETKENMTELKETHYLANKTPCSTNTRSSSLWMGDVGIVCLVVVALVLI